MATLTCRHCGRLFQPYRGKPGLIDECPNCASEPVPRLLGVTVYDDKNTSIMVPVTPNTFQRVQEMAFRKTSPLRQLIPTHKREVKVRTKKEND